MNNDDQNSTSVPDSPGTAAPTIRKIPPLAETGLPQERAAFPALDLASIREKLNGVRGQQYWQSLDEVAETPEFQEMLHREFPPGATEWEDGVSRRSFLKMAAASLALAGLTACTKQPNREILPYVRQPEELVLGNPLFYATSMLLNGYATGVLAKSREGHPIKVDGNPQHPAALGASSIWMQASIIDLYDPDRSQTVTHNGEISTWSQFLSGLNEIVRAHEANSGQGLHFLTESIASPTIAAQLDGLMKRFPKAKLHQFDAVTRDNVREGARLAFGELVETHYRFDRADVIVSLESDFLYAHPQRLRYTRDFADGRRLSGGRNEMNRLYVVESTPTVTGSNADHRFPLESGKVEEFARQLAKRIQSNTNAAPALLSAIASDLEKARGKSIVIAGEWQPPVVHALAHWMNEQLGNVGKTVFYTQPPGYRTVQQVQSMRELADDMKSGAVQTLFILGGNPIYNAPSDFEFAAGLRRVKNSVHLGLQLDETAAQCAWHIPQAHYLESWGDASAFDGTISLMQPLITPLYNGKTIYEVLGAMTLQNQSRSDYEIVREYWRNKKIWPDFDTGWRRALHDGFIAGTALPEKKVRLTKRLEDLDANARGESLVMPGSSPSPEITRHESEGPVLVPQTEERSQFPQPTKSSNAQTNAQSNTNSEKRSAIELTFRPDPCIWDGSFANNGWLQECAKPVNKLTWDNAVYMSPALAERLDLVTSDVVELTLQNRTIRGPVWVMPGQAENSITLHLGFGRQRVGRVGEGVGFDVYPLRTSDSMWRATGIVLKKTQERHRLVTTQTHHNLHSEDRQVFRQGTLKEFLNDAQFVKKSVEIPDTNETLYYPNEFKYDGYKWAMSIDLTTCIGCNACLLACNVENNIPIVGKDQVKVNREMYWIRIDTYYKGSLDNPEFNHMPVPCMQCEHAPCELVCPVEATVHDHEGLNLMVYNRCVGTRFCSNNCPYKVRRFNFLRYTDYQTPNWKPMYNPEVTVRWRGVMEKCSYCVQRIAAARINAEKENRRIRDGEFQTACQQACPAQAIVFGDLNAPGSKIAKLKAHPLDYPMLGNLNTRPRTTYLAKLQNRNQEIDSQSQPQTDPEAG